eukprot:1224929-Rhodomonas_salina.1
MRKILGKPAAQQHGCKAGGCFPSPSAGHPFNFINQSDIQARPPKSAKLQELNLYVETRKCSQFRHILLGSRSPPPLPPPLPPPPLPPLPPRPPPCGKVARTVAVRVEGTGM